MTDITIVRIVESFSNLDQAVEEVGLGNMYLFCIEEVKLALQVSVYKHTLAEQIELTRAIFDDDNERVGVLVAEALFELDDVFVV